MGFLEDGTLCRGSLCTPVYCQEGSCSHEVSRECDDQIGCTLDECDEEQGCFHTPNDFDCEDNDPCTNTFCDLEQGCVTESIPDCKSAEEPGCGCKIKGKAETHVIWIVAVLFLCMGLSTVRRGTRKHERSGAIKNK